MYYKCRPIHKVEVFVNVPVLYILHCICGVKHVYPVSLKLFKNSRLIITHVVDVKKHIYLCNQDSIHICSELQF